MAVRYHNRRSPQGGVLTCIKESRTKKIARDQKSKKKLQEDTRNITNTIISLQQFQKKSYFKFLFEKKQNDKVLQQQWKALVKKATHQQAIWPLPQLSIRWKLDPTEGQFIYLFSLCYC